MSERRASRNVQDGPRTAGLIIPLFSCVSSASWGIGEIPDIAPLTEWMRGAELSVLQILPLNEMAAGQQSPYSAMSAMAIDPIFLRVTGLEDFEAVGGEASLSAVDRDALRSLRRSTTIDYPTVRRLKQSALRAAFERFVDVEWSHETRRAKALRMFVTAQAWWVEDYSVFRAIHAREHERPWTEWAEELQRREPAAIDRVRRELAHEVLYYQYLQWLAAMQWHEVRHDTNGVALFGDLPFMVDTDSADVWARQHQFDLDVSIGAPPDAFSAEGQNWGTPLYRWDVIERESFHWLRERARRCADLFDGFRIDHLVGFYRTYGRPRDGSPAFFSPPSEPEQIALGERLLKIFREPGSDVIAEDLGTVPDFVRASLARLGVPGLKVFRWERHWHQDGQPFRQPGDYPPTSVAVSGTHDTEPMMTWWASAPEEEKQKVRAVVPGAAANASCATIRDALIEALFASGSRIALLPIQDVFGWRERINDPSVVADSNWVFRLPWLVDRLDEIVEAQERQAALRNWAANHRR
jgi:4-alpha-glucanotransferase